MSTTTMLAGTVDKLVKILAGFHKDIVDVTWSTQGDKTIVVTCALNNNARILQNLLNGFYNGHHPWVCQLDTRCSSTLRLNASFDVSKFTADDFNIEVDYKICIFKSLKDQLPKS